MQHNESDNISELSNSGADAGAEADEASCFELPCGKAAGRPRAADLESRMQNLVATAASLFIEKGYSNVSLEMIAREAHVAVRTIYVKFGGKVGLFSAVLNNGRAHFFANIGDMETDTRSIPQILSDFGMRFLSLVTAPGSLSLQRMVIAETKTSPELARTFFDTGPAQTREVLTRFFARADIRAQLRENIPYDLLPIHLISTILGDIFTMYLLEQKHPPNAEEIRAAMEQRLSLFYLAVLR
ncbi:MAG: TetR/AcrR family transcriptional regulator [Pseudomonadota bacterium]